MNAESDNSGLWQFQHTADLCTQSCRLHPALSITVNKADFWGLQIEQRRHNIMAQKMSKMLTHLNKLESLGLKGMNTV